MSWHPFGFRVCRIRVSLGRSSYLPTTCVCSRDILQSPHPIQKLFRLLRLFPQEPSTRRSGHNVWLCSISQQNFATWLHRQLPLWCQNLTCLFRTQVRFFRRFSPQAGRQGHSPDESFCTSTSHTNHPKDSILVVSAHGPSQFTPCLSLVLLPPFVLHFEQIGFCSPFIEWMPRH